jgi:hypothetical protein
MENRGPEGTTILFGAKKKCIRNEHRRKKRKIKGFA